MSYRSYPEKFMKNKVVKLFSGLQIGAVLTASGAAVLLQMPRRSIIPRPLLPPLAALLGWWLHKVAMQGLVTRILGQEGR